MKGERADRRTAPLTTNDERSTTNDTRSPIPDPTIPPLPHLLLFAIGLLAGTMNVMAGGGSAISLAVLLFLGLDGATANGTNRIAILVQNLFAMGSFQREKVGRIRQGVSYAVWALPGAILGALVAVRIGDAWFERLLGVIMVGIVVSMLIPRPQRETTPEGRQSRWIYPALFAIGFYGGFIQVGVGFLLMAAFYHLLRMNLVFVNVHKVTVVLLYTLPALVVFAVGGHVAWALGLSLAAGNAVGGWWAARLAVRRGEGIIRIVLMIAILVMAAHLLGLF